MIQAAATPNTANHRMFAVHSSGELTITGITLQNGRCEGGCATHGDPNDAYRGSVVFNLGGKVRIINSTLQNNANSPIYVTGGGYLEMSYARVMNNTGRAIFFEGGTGAIQDSVFYKNTADYGGAINFTYPIGDPLMIERSSFEGNTASENGGAIYADDPADSDNLIIFASTFYDNTAKSGGAIYTPDTNMYFELASNTIYKNKATAFGGVSGIVAGELSFGNNIIADNASGVDCFATTMSDNTYNLVEDGSCSDGGGNFLTGDPKLGAPIYISPLHKLLAFPPLYGSPVIDSGTDSEYCGSTDVFNRARPIGAHCDRGSYEVDARSQTFRSTGAQDGWVLESTETSGVGGTLNATATTFNLGDDAAKKQYRAILSFNTASLPDNAVITKVTLKVRQQGVTGGGNPVSIFQGFMADVRRGPFGAASLAASDFSAAANRTVGPTSPAPVGGWYSLNLTAAKACINKLSSGSGLTQIRLRFKLDDNNNSIANFLSLFSGNAGAASRPQLIIEYYVP